MCWEDSIVSSLCRDSLIVPVLKKEARCECDTNTYRGISLTFIVSKVVCTILNARLSDVAE